MQLGIGREGQQRLFNQWLGQLRLVDLQVHPSQLAGVLGRGTVDRNSRLEVRPGLLELAAGGEGHTEVAAITRAQHVIGHAREYVNGTSEELVSLARRLAQTLTLPAQRQDHGVDRPQRRLSRRMRAGHGCRRFPAGFRRRFLGLLDPLPRGG